MRICDICKNDPANTGQSFSGDFGGMRFVVNVSARKNPSSTLPIDICQDCAAKAVLRVMGMESPKVDKPS